MSELGKSSRLARARARLAELRAQVVGRAGRVWVVVTVPAEHAGDVGRFTAWALIDTQSDEILATVVRNDDDGTWQALIRAAGEHYVMKPGPTLAEAKHFAETELEGMGL